MSSSASNSPRKARRRFSSSSPFLTPFALPVQPVLGTLSLSPDSEVLELGTVACRFTLPIARFFDTKKGTGTVHSCEFDEESVQRTYQKAKDAHLIHLVSPLLWDPASPAPIPMDDENADVIIAINSPVFRVTPTKFVSECTRVLRPGGKLFLARWRDARRPLSELERKLERSKQETLDILSKTPGTVCTPLDISELEWAVMMEKPLAQVSSLLEAR